MKLSHEEKIMQIQELNKLQNQEVIRHRVAMQDNNNQFMVSKNKDKIKSLNQLKMDENTLKKKNEKLLMQLEMKEMEYAKHLETLQKNLKIKTVIQEKKEIENQKLANEQKKQDEAKNDSKP